MTNLQASMLQRATWCRRLIEVYKFKYFDGTRVDTILLMTAFAITY